MIMTTKKGIVLTHTASKPEISIKFRIAVGKKTNVGLPFPHCDQYQQRKIKCFFIVIEIVGFTVSDCRIEAQFRDRRL